MTSTATFDQYPFLRGGGEMGTLIRAYDWAASPLGSPAIWPPSLRTSVSNMLHAGLPMLVLWGPDMICLYNDFVIPSLDPATQHPAIGKSSAEIWPHAWSVVGPLLKGVLQSGEPVTFQDVPMLFYRQGKTEEVFWTFCYSAIVTEDGSIGGILATCLETTQGVRSRQQLDQNQHRILASFQEAPVGIAMISKDKLTFRMANPFYGFLVGRPPEEIVDKPLLEALPELVGQGFDALLEQVIETGKSYNATEVAVDIVRNNKLETIYVDLTYQPRREADNHVSGVLVVATDVTQQVRARQQVEASESRFRSLIEQAPVAIGVFVGGDMMIETANDPMIGFWGKGRSVIGKPLREALPELEGQPFLTILNQVYTTGEPYSGQGMRADLVVEGQLKTFYYDFTYQPIRDGNGEVYAIMDVAVDVTEKTVLRRQYEQTQQAIHNAVELADLATWHVDVLNGQVSYSERYHEWMGLGRQTEIRHAFDAVDPSQAAQVETAYLNAISLTSDGRMDVEFAVANIHTGKPRLLHVVGQTQRDGQGEVVSISGFAQDVTHLRATQLSLENQVSQRTKELQMANDQLVQANELLAHSNENLQTFAYVASHDLQEPLRKIQQFGDILRRRLADSMSGDVAVYLERIQSAAGRMSTLINDLLSFSRISGRRNSEELISLNAVVDSVLSVLDMAIEESGAQVQIDPLPTVSGDAFQMELLFQNLLSNAIKFHRNGISPRIHISSMTLQETQLPLTVRPIRRTRLYHRIDVSDNGIGFEEKYLDRIFQIFQRLHGKKEYIGTGIGLAICEKVVTNHGGAITAVSRPDQGATFSVYFPAEELGAAL